MDIFKDLYVRAFLVCVEGKPSPDGMVEHLAVLNTGELPVPRAVMREMIARASRPRFTVHVYAAVERNGDLAPHGVTVRFLEDESGQIIKAYGVDAMPELHTAESSAAFVSMPFDFDFAAVVGLTKFRCELLIDGEVRAWAPIWLKIVDVEVPPVPPAS